MRFELVPAEKKGDRPVANCLEPLKEEAAGTRRCLGRGTLVGLGLMLVGRAWRWRVAWMGLLLAVEWDPLMLLSIYGLGTAFLLTSVWSLIVLVAVEVRQGSCTKVWHGESGTDSQ